MGIKARIRKIKRKVEKHKAKRRGMTVTEFREHKRKIKEARTKARAAEEIKLEKFKVTEKFRQKRKQIRKGGGVGLGTKVFRAFEQASKNAAENLNREFGEAPRFRTKKPRKPKVTSVMVNGTKITISKPRKKRKKKRRKR